jgi:hypothetical protein
MTSTCGQREGGKLSLAHVSSLDKIVSYRGVEVNIPSTAPCVKAMAIKRYERGKTRMTFHQSRDVTVLFVVNQMAFPMTGNCTILDFRRPFPCKTYSFKHEECRSFPVSSLLASPQASPPAPH